MDPEVEGVSGMMAPAEPPCPIMLVLYRVVVYVSALAAVETSIWVL